VQADEEIPEPTLADLALAIQRETMLKVYTCLPARVLAYHSPGPDAVGEGMQPARVDLLVSLKRRVLIDKIEDLPQGYELEQPIGDEEPDRLIALGDYPPILRAVVMRPSAGDSTMRLRGAVAVGTRGVAFIAARSLDRWATRSGQVDPVFTHTHEISDVFFFADAREGPAEVVDPPAAGLWSDDGTVGLSYAPGVAGTAKLAAPNVELGLGATGTAAVAEKVNLINIDLKAKALALPLTGNPIADLALVAVKGLFASWLTPSVSSSTVKIPPA